jgi:16S rRNA (cytosine967-C5)-methyltransferase
VHLQGRPNVFGSRAWREGRFEVQDEGSQLIVGLCAPRPGERCVDFCAGAGGKTLALAALMGDRGELLALDVDRQRVADQQPRLARAGVTCVRSRVIDPAGALPPEAADADLVLVDAPCSSLGTLRRGPDARWRTTPEKVETFPALQLEILGRAATLVGRAGRLVYATCTLNAAENERVAGSFEAAHPEFRRTPVAELLGAATADRLGAVDRLWLAPHLHGTDGFFAVHWRRDGR